MQAIVLVKAEQVNKETGYKYGVELQQVPTPKPSEGQVLVKIQAFSFNHRDNWIRKGQYPGIKAGSICGSDAVGIVTEVWSSSDSSLVGKEVIIQPGANWDSDPRGPEGMYGILGSFPLSGTFAEYIVVDRADVALRPKHLSLAEAAALPLGGLTAYRATFTKAEVRAGDNVLITGIGGGVALLAMAFAIAAGANVYVTSGDESKIEKAKSLGAKGGVNYKKESWPSDLKSLLNGAQLNAVIDGAGGSAYLKYQSLMKVGSIIACYGMTAEPQVPFGMGYVLKNIELRGSTMGSRREFNEMVAFVNEKQVRPVVSRVWKGFTIDNMEEAYTEMRNHSQFGKLVIEIGASEHKL